MRRDQAIKFARSFTEKAFQMNQRQHTEATTVDFRNVRSRKRAQTSRVFPSNENNKKNDTYAYHGIYLYYFFTNFFFSKLLSLTNIRLHP